MGSKECCVYGMMEGMEGVNNFFHNTLGKAKGGRWLGFHKDAGKLSMDG